jgi:hypothetical protein
MTAACNKFLRIYFARVSEYLNSLEAASNVEAPASAEDRAAGRAESERIDAADSVDTNSAFTCEQDSAPVECDASGSQGFAYTNGAASVVARDNLLARTVG